MARIFEPYFLGILQRLAAQVRNKSSLVLLSSDDSLRLIPPQMPKRHSEAAQQLRFEKRFACSVESLFRIELGAAPKAAAPFPIERDITLHCLQVLAEEAAPERGACIEKNQEEHISPVSSPSPTDIGSGASSSTALPTVSSPPDITRCPPPAAGPTSLLGMAKRRPSTISATLATTGASEPKPRKESC